MSLILELLDHLRQAEWGHPIEDRLREIVQGSPEAPKEGELERLLDLGRTVLNRGMDFDGWCHDVLSKAPNRAAALIHGSGLRGLLRSVSTKNELSQFDEAWRETKGTISGELADIEASVEALERELPAQERERLEVDELSSVEDRLARLRTLKAQWTGRRIGLATARIEALSRDHLARFRRSPGREWTGERSPSVRLLLSRAGDLKLLREDDQGNA